MTGNRDNIEYPVAQIEGYDLFGPSFDAKEFAHTRRVAPDDRDPRAPREQRITPHVVAVSVTVRDNELGWLATVPCAPGCQQAVHWARDVHATCSRVEQ